MSSHNKISLICLRFCGSYSLGLSLCRVRLYNSPIGLASIVPFLTIAYQSQFLILMWTRGLSGGSMLFKNIFFAPQSLHVPGLSLPLANAISQ
jgi:hypothetical protein